MYYKRFSLEKARAGTFRGNISPDLVASNTTGSHGRNGMPSLNARLNGTKQSFVMFRNAFSNSTATDVSWPAILTGIEPSESIEILHHFPMISNLAKLSGFKTSIYSSWRLEWANMLPFLRGGLFDKIVGASEIGTPIVNDLGIDDMETSTQISKFIRDEVSKDEKLFLIFATNGLHHPHQRISTYLAPPDPTISRYEAALNIVDHAMEKVFQTLEETGRLDEALIMITGDHGEGFRQKNQVIRITSFYDYFVKIPFLIKLPKSIPTELKDALVKNSEKNIQNIDIAPTIAHILGHCNPDKPESFCHVYRGTSLFSDVKPDRTIVTLNTNDVRRWVPEGFGIYKNNLRVLFSSSEPEFRAFDIATDPHQTKDIWQDLPRKDKKPILQLVKKERHLKRIVELYRKNGSIE